jgi:uncharacterized protein (DUF427 family)
MSHALDHTVKIAPFRRRLEARFGDAIIAVSDRAMIVTETGLQDRFYIPPHDVTGVLEPTPRRSTCPFKGGARYWTLRIAGA